MTEFTKKRTNVETGDFFFFFCGPMQIANSLEQTGITNLQERVYNKHNTEKRLKGIQGIREQGPFTNPTNGPKVQIMGQRPNNNRVPRTHLSLTVGFKL